MNEDSQNVIREAEKEKSTDKIRKRRGLILVYIRLSMSRDELVISNV